METAVAWHVDMEFREIDAKTEAIALLRLQDGTELRSHGRANKHPDDPEQPRVGEEIAAARALNGLSRQLLARAGVEIEEATHVPAHLAM